MEIYVSHAYLYQKPMLLEQGTTSATLLYQQCNQSMHMTDGMRVMSLSASLQHKTSPARDCLCQTTLNPKLLCFIYAKLC